LITQNSGIRNSRKRSVLNIDEFVIKQKKKKEREIKTDIVQAYLDMY
jgi:hypothetical protein